MKHHFETAHGETTTFDCSLCDETFEDETYLRLHKKLVHEEKIQLPDEEIYQEGNKESSQEIDPLPNKFEHNSQPDCEMETDNIEP